MAEFPRIQKLATELEVSNERQQWAESGADIMADILAAYDRLSVQWESPRATQFRCGEDVRQHLWDQYVVPYQMKPPVAPPPAAGDALFGIPIIVDDAMAPGAWRVLDQHGNVMREGGIA